MLKERRLKKGRTQKDFADKIGVNPSTICRWEKNPGSIGANKLMAVCKAYGISITELCKELAA